MIKNQEEWRRWEAKWQKETPVDVEKNFKILDGLIKQARLLEKWPPKDPLEGIEVDIKMARVLNTYVKKHSG